MRSDESSLDDIALTRVLHMNAIVTGFVTGITLGLVVFAATIWLVAKGGERIGPHLSLLNQFFVGYDVSLFGSLVGFGYASGIGFLVGYLFARLYNWLLSIRDGSGDEAAS